MAKRIDPATLQKTVGTFYPPPYDEPCRARERTRLGDPAGLTQFGVNLLRLPPGAWSSQRHWHTGEDEFVYVLSGEVVLVTDEGEEVLRAGDAAGFPANEGNGHCLQNRSDKDAQLLEVGTRQTGSPAQGVSGAARVGAGFERAALLVDQDPADGPGEPDPVGPALDLMAAARELGADFLREPALDIEPAGVVVVRRKG
jgi:uncharacterized cupin superfamily protein